MIHSNICCGRLSGGEPLLKIWNEQRNCKTEANLSDLELVIQLWRAARSSDDATVATASQAHRACRWFEIAGEPCATVSVFPKLIIPDDTTYDIIVHL